MSRRKLIIAIMVMLAVPSLARSESRSATLVRNIEYARPDDFSLKCDMYLPHASKNNGSAVLMVHGGAWMSGKKTHVARHAWRAAEAGYVVMAIDYRLAPIFRFPAQIDDCRQALRWLRANSEKYSFQRDRVVGYGYSAGGQLVCLLGLTANEPEMELQAIVAGGAPCDFRQVPEKSRTLAYWLGGTRGEQAEAYKTASPAAFVSKDDPPVFFYHGTKDRIVPAESPQAMSRLMEKAGVPAELHWVEGKGHIGAFLDDRAAERAVLFMNKALAASEAAESQVARGPTANSGGDKGN